MSKSDIGTRLEWLLSEAKSATRTLVNEADIEAREALGRLLAAVERDAALSRRTLTEEIDPHAAAVTDAITNCLRTLDHALHRMR